MNYETFALGVVVGAAAAQLFVLALVLYFSRVLRRLLAPQALAQSMMMGAMGGAFPRSPADIGGDAK